MSHDTFDPKSVVRLRGCAVRPVDGAVQRTLLAVCSTVPVGRNRQNGARSSWGWAGQKQSVVRDRDPRREPLASQYNWSNLCWLVKSSPFHDCR